ncbi:MAG TPA: hypothetical protein VKS01_06590 [Bryobacteraceae bacterium]|nr:hypothetical protein [Bryobacteraceae bacterium]
MRDRPVTRRPFGCLVQRLLIRFGQWFFIEWRRRDSIAQLDRPSIQEDSSLQSPIRLEPIHQFMNLLFLVNNILSHG